VSKQNHLTLIEYCKKCGGSCCIGGKPRLSQAERDKILENVQQDFFNKEPSGYYVTQQKEGYCSYWSEKICSIQHVKPIDCELYPIDPVMDKDGNISFVIELFCPACEGGLDPDYIAKAILLSVDWMKEFSYEQFIDYWEKHKVKKDIIDLKEYLASMGTDFSEEVKGILREKLTKDKNTTMEDWAGSNKVTLPF